MYMCIYVWYVCVFVHMCEWECMHATVHMLKTEQPWVSLHPFHSIFVSLLGTLWASRNPSDSALHPSHGSSTDVCYHDQCYEGPNSDTHTCIRSLPTKSSHQSYRPVIVLLRREESTLEDNTHVHDPPNHQGNLQICHWALLNLYGYCLEIILQITVYLVSYLIYSLNEAL